MENEKFCFEKNTKEERENYCPSRFNFFSNQKIYCLSPKMKKSIGYYSVSLSLGLYDKENERKFTCDYCKLNLSSETTLKMKYLRPQNLYAGQDFFYEINKKGVDKLEVI